MEVLGQAMCVVLIGESTVPGPQRDVADPGEVRQRLHGVVCEPRVGTTDGGRRRVGAEGHGGLNG